MAKKFTKFEKFQWTIFFIACLFFFTWYFVMGFFGNCIFELPIRWDIKTCWNEQYEPAKIKASEKAINFMP